MSSRDAIPLLIAAIGGLGGLVATLVYSDMLRAVNRQRPPDNQVPFGLITWGDFVQHWPLRRRRVAKEFRRIRPESHLYRWYVASLIWMYVLIAIAFAAAVILSERPAHGGE